MVRSNTCEAGDIETAVRKGKKSPFQNYREMCLENKHSQIGPKFVAVNKLTSFSRFVQSLCTVDISGLIFITNFPNQEGCGVPTWGRALAIYWPRVLNHNC